jgi:L-2,4-diaminobutyrate decarboxylase
MSPSNTDTSFQPPEGAMQDAVHWIARRKQLPAAQALGETLPLDGLGESAALALLAPHVLGQACDLASPDAFAHMDPPTPWITWAVTAWNASLNQNLLHPATSPFARVAEARVMDWLSPYFGMQGGHMTPGSTVANITALWAAREVRKVKRVIASAASHLSVGKAAKLLGLEYQSVACLPSQQMDSTALAALGDLSDACLVLTAGSTAAGAVDALSLAGRAAWTHVDAAWAGPLRLSSQHTHYLAGIENADSVAVSAHKWLFQPKESALIMFKDVATAHVAVSSGGAYLAVPNVGVLGSHGAVATSLMATLLAWGQNGLAERIDRCMHNADTLHALLSNDSRWTMFAPPSTGVFLARPTRPAPDAKAVLARLPNGVASSAVVNGETWLRFVAANPMAEPAVVYERLVATLNSAAC